MFFLDKNPEYTDDTYVSTNLAVLHVYYKTLHFMRHERGELYGLVDFFSNIGGLMGLCMGFSALSLVEVVYFFTLRELFHQVLNWRRCILKIFLKKN
jgi:amiloride-sensitive sodium channel